MNEKVLTFLKDITIIFSEICNTTIFGTFVDESEEVVNVEKSYRGLFCIVNESEIVWICFRAKYLEWSSSVKCIAGQSQKFICDGG